MESLSAQLLINEIACATSGDDWVELFYKSNKREKQDISKLFVTMYYGINERLADEAVSIYSYDRAETPYDDRFIIVHYTDTPVVDETDRTGDTNRNGYIDIYCNNYSASLWNSDGIVAIDTDDDPSNGGIIDFVAYSNRDGSPNETISGYVFQAIQQGEWHSHIRDNIQTNMVDIGIKGLLSHMTISRDGKDTNGPSDFKTTTFQTPGKKNIFSESFSGNKRIFRPLRKKITAIPGHIRLGKARIELFIYEVCNIRFRIFSSIGMLIYESPLYSDLLPGRYSLSWKLKGAGRRACTGLYIGHIEASSSKLKRTEKDYIYIIVSHYK